jgi:hypothetical protein
MTDDQTLDDQIVTALRDGVDGAMGSVAPPPFDALRRRGRRSMAIAAGVGVAAAGAVAFGATQAVESLTSEPPRTPVAATSGSSDADNPSHGLKASTCAPGHISWGLGYVFNVRPGFATAADAVAARYRVPPAIDVYTGGDGTTYADVLGDGGVVVTTYELAEFHNGWFVSGQAACLQ